MYKCLRLDFNEINELNFARVSHKLCFTSEMLFLGSFTQYL